MDSILGQMIARYEAQNINEKKNAIKEVLQEIALAGLSRAGFFEKAAFYGGTALRIFYGLDRFSEDLDFSLMTADESFRLADYFPVLEREVASFGLSVTVTEKEKSADTGIRSAFLKGNTKEQIFTFFADEAATGVSGNDTVKIKFEVDVTPPPGATFEHRYQMMPIPYEITLYDLPSLFAGKVHAVICRAWKNRVKGRDLYDYLFYLSQGAKLNTEHLKYRLVESGVWEAEKPFTLADAKELLCARFDRISFAQAREDVLPFVKDTAALRLWSAEYFKQVTERLS